MWLVNCISYRFSKAKRCQDLDRRGIQGLCELPHGHRELVVELCCCRTNLVQRHPGRAATVLTGPKTAMIGRSAARRPLETSRSRPICYRKRRRRVNDPARPDRGPRSVLRGAPGARWRRARDLGARWPPPQLRSSENNEASALAPAERLPQPTAHGSRERGLRAVWQRNRDVCWAEERRMVLRHRLELADARRPRTPEARAHARPQLSAS